MNPGPRPKDQPQT
ncbi:hypothetical protein RDI58_029026 [Solanum bulbocastanum]|uniref:Uncharacterized protein n=1 Tax=Solanum bulbocastanum TaxID=147425 RepID=A0AAN8Y1Q5_SOLBU